MSKGKGKANGTSTNGVRADLPWIEKYRPSSLDEIAGHADILATINKFIDDNSVPHLLFHGPPGTGKTSTILAIARKLYGNKFSSMVLELNASDDRGIDVVREQIKTFASTRQMFASSGFKLIILDESDAMTNAAQNALRTIVEKYTANTRFCLICNYTHKLTPALQSRTTRFRFGPLAEAAVVARMREVIEIEGIDITDDAVNSLVEISRGDMRKALNVLQSVHAASSDTSITVTDIYNCIASPHPDDIATMLDSLLSASFDSSLSTINTLKTMKGLALGDILEGLTDMLAARELPPTQRAKLVDGMSQIEWRLSSGGNEKIQVSALAGVFV